MIDKFCDWITEKIKQSMPEIDEEKEMIINFGVKLIFGELPKILILFLIGFLVGLGLETIILFFLIVPYRASTGGFHLKTHLGCMISTTVLYIAPILLAKYLEIPHNYILYITTVMLGIMSIILIAKYAPADTENMPILSKKERKVKRIKAYISLAVLLTVIVFIPNNLISSMLIYGIVLQNLTVTPIAYKLSKCKYGYEVYTEETI